ncbi:MAG: hypothetical protein QF444_00815, partial [Phycisphaerales bacterium]|nr:hypothetical protein [Phycisphaerales bacterium]
MSNKEPPNNIPPPHPSKFAQSRQAWIVFGVTSAFCILLVALLFSLSDRQSPKQLEEQSQFVIDLLEAPTESTAETVDASSPELGVSLSSGGWIKQTDRLGNLSQQYRCTSLDPAPANLPKGWIEMTDPDVELFLSPSRVVRISGQSAIANAPKQTLESGDIYGNVRIELFEGERINTTIDTPSVVMTTPQASFDNFLGEVSCDSEVRIVSEDGSYLAGRKLSIRFNDTNGRIEYLRLEEVDRIELYQQLATTQVPIHKSRQSTAQPFSKKHQVSASAIENNEQYYLLTLSDKVFIHQGDSLTGKEGRGDRMTIAFALESTSPGTANRQAQKARNSFLGPTATIVASMLGTHSDSPT